MLSWLNEFCFADDAAVVAATKKNLIEATIELDRVVQACGLTISVPKTKFLVAGNGVTQSDLEPIHVGGSAIESVSSFRYLGSVVECRGGVNAELTARVSQAATIFGAMRRSVFSDKLLCLQTKRMVYQAVVLGVLLYAVETWPIKQSNLHSLEVFHHQCLRNFLVISKSQQIAQHISNEEVRHRIGLLSPLSDIISSRRLHWLRHLARMCDHRLPKQMLFGWLPQSHPPLAG